MGYRGSKPVMLDSTTVKEQRVDGSYTGPIPVLRCTRFTLFARYANLMGFERNYQVKIPAKVFLRKNYSTLSNLKLNPWFITGFSDAEGSFIISIYKDNNTKLKWRVSAYFSIHIHTKDALLLELIHKYLGVGKLRQNNENTVLLRVSDIKELEVIIDHFKKYPLVSAKYADFLLFEQCFNIIKKKEHLTEDGFKRILELRVSLNKGLSPELKESFPYINSVARPVYKFNGIPNPNWITGFATGDSSFSLSIEKSTSKVGLSSTYAHHIYYISRTSKY
uniref:Homing endonuclease LAGLIDADG domain-containing protein n=1 Tax=Juglanconis juglandina TaxID=1940567 RepID=A0A291LJG6_9PEZI|nr:hypothetical protein [Juglanconis juglandina]